MTFGLRLGLKEETMHMKIIGQRAPSKGKSSKAAKVEISLVFSNNLQCPGMVRAKARRRKEKDKQ